MKVTKDSELGGVAMVYPGVQDLIETAERLDPNAGYVGGSVRTFGLPRMTTWADVKAFYRSLWAKGIETVRSMSAEIASTRPPEPVSITRKRRWSEEEGDVDVDKYLGGQDRFLRELHRERRPRCTTVAVMCNVCANCYVTNENLFWRSAAAVVAIDLLEEAGYSCEVWGWGSSRGCYYGSHDKSFFAFPLKQAGDPVDTDVLAKGMSPWLFRTAIFASLKAGGETRPGLGSHNTVNKERWMSRHCEVDKSVEQLWVPDVTSRHDAILAVRGMIETIQNELV